MSKNGHPPWASFPVIITWMIVGILILAAILYGGIFE